MKAFLLTLTLAMVLGGCGGPAKNGAAGDSDAQAMGEDTAIEIAVIPKSLSHQFWMTVKAGAEAAASEAGATVVWQGAAEETDIEKQLNIVQDMINRNVDAIVLAASDKNALVQRVEQAKRAGIPVITIDSGVESEAPLSFVATDNVAGAKMAADVLAELCGEEGLVGLIPFVPGAATSEMRETGFREGLAQYPNMTLGPVQYSQSDPAIGMNVAQDMLTSHPELKGIFAANESSAVGAAQALKASGRAGDVKLVAFDASKEQLQALRDGAIQALVVQNPFKMGYLGVRAALAAIAGKAVEKRIDTGVTVVTLENIEDPEIQALLNPS